MVGAATEVFGQRGYAAASMDDIAAKAGITKPMLYSYFGSKEGLFAACATGARDGLEARLREVAADRDLGFDQRLWRALLTVFEFVDRHRDAWRVLYPGGAEPAGELGRAAHASRRSMEQLVSRLFADAARSRGMGEQGAAQAAAMAAGFAAATIAAASAWADSPEEPRDLATLRLMNLVWMGLGRLLDGEMWLPGSGPA